MIVQFLKTAIDRVGSAWVPTIDHEDWKPDAEAWTVQSALLSQATCPEDDRAMAKIHGVCLATFNKHLSECNASQEIALTTLRRLYERFAS